MKPPMRAGVLILLLIMTRSADAREIDIEGPPDQISWFEARLPTLRDEVELALGVTTAIPIRVRLARTEKQFVAWAGAMPDWVVAIARPAERTLVVRLSRTGAGSGTDVSSVLRHELVHILLPERIGDALVPRWFEEGLAQYLGGRLNRRDRLRVPAAAAAGNLIPLHDLEDAFPRSGTDVALAYAQGESVVEYLVSLGGRHGLGMLMDELRAGRKFPSAVLAVYHVTPRALEYDWQEWVATEGEPWWIALLTDSIVPLLLFAAAILAILAGWKARRRARATYDSLPE
jgi:hypothetical protein